MTAAKKKAPSIGVRARGRVNAVLDMLGGMYKEANPDRDCRWVYAPTHKPELSNVLTRRAQGYVSVKVEELPQVEDFMPGASPDADVRIADVVLMSIEKELRDIFADDLHKAASEQAARVEESYYRKLREEEEIGGLGRRHAALATGRTGVEEKEFEYDIEQRTSDEEGGG